MQHQNCPTEEWARVRHPWSSGLHLEPRMTQMCTDIERSYALENRTAARHAEARR